LGQAIYARFKHAGRHFLYGFEFENLSPNFRADYGFIPRVDILRLSGYLEPVIWGKHGGWFDRISLNIHGEKITDHNNILTDSRLQVSVNYKGPLQTFITPMFTTTKELYNGKVYYLNRLETYIKMRPLGALNYFLLARIGDTIDYFNSRKSDSLLLNPRFEWRIGHHLNIDVNHIYERVYIEKKKIYTANLFQVLLGYHFNVRTFFRAIIQFTDINRNVALYTIPIEPRSKDLFTQFLFSYRINPQTVLFLGYSDNHSGWNGIELTRKDRTFFFKIGYALAL
jgi:hypothetical protein